MSRSSAHTYLPLEERPARRKRGEKLKGIINYRKDNARNFKKK
jgi:hypothetical protein